MPDLTELAEALERTEGLLHDVADMVDIHQTTLHRGKVAFTMAIVGLVADLTLTVFLGWGLFGVNHNQDRINSLQSAVQLETDRNKTSQCAVVTLFLQIAPKMIANPGYTPEQHALQAQAYQTLQQIGQDLGCA